jgi:hypothetical protein
MTTIYVVRGYDDYEASMNIKAFETEEDAQLFVYACDTHNMRYPKGTAAIAKWRKAAPEGYVEFQNYTWDALELV